MRLEDLGLIGNCQFSALVENTGRVVWCCLPRFDSEPVFGALLDEAEGGAFSVGPAGGQPGRQRYLDNTNILETAFDTPEGRFRVLDFAPRFTLHERLFRPTQLVRILEPLSGSPRVSVRCAPRLGWSKAEPTTLQGSHHVRYEGYASQLRLTTDLPLTHLGGRPFTLTERRYLVLAWGPPVEESLAPLCERYLSETARYWDRWVKHSNIPPLFQQEVIRSALALKLHCYEDTGAIVAAMTTSIPEAPGSGRTWDYRYCWLRDAYYALDAFRRLGHFEEREQFTVYLLNIASGTPELDLRPLYAVDGGSQLDERVLPHWAGYNGEQPVRVGNAAAEHQQHDVFGEMVLALAPIYMDDRFTRERSPAVLELLMRLARKAAAVAGTPDAGIWEFRKEWQPQTFSSLMCWAANERMARIAQRHAPSCAEEFRSAHLRIHEHMFAEGWHAGLGSFVGTYGGADLDAALLQMAPLRFLARDDRRLHATIDAVRTGLDHRGWLYRYRQDDGLGATEMAFTLCTFWLIQALALTGRVDEARRIMDTTRQVRTPLGLLSEDFDPVSGAMWGNFPQAYSHVGLIHAAFSASPRWTEVL